MKYKKYDHIDWTGLRLIRRKLINPETRKPYLQTDVANLAGMTQANYSNLEKGRIRSPDDRYVEGLAAAFATSVPDLLASLPEKKAGKRKSLEEREVFMPRVIPKYANRCNLANFHFHDGIMVSGFDFTAIPPVVTDVPDAYALTLQTSDMEPRYKMWDVLYVNPDEPPVRGDEVVITLHYDNFQIMLVRHLIDMESHADDDEEDSDPMTVYGVVPSQVYFSSLMNKTNDAFAEFEALRSKLMWFPANPEFVDPPWETHIKGQSNGGFPHKIDVHVVVACDRFRHARTSGRLKRALRNSVELIDATPDFNFDETE